MGNTSSIMRRCMETDREQLSPDVTVIVLTYGVFDGVDRTLSSIAEQTYNIKAVIVSDDGSGEKFPIHILQKFSNVELRQNERNLGTVAHMNVAAGTVGSKYIKFLAAGDAFSDPTALEALICFAEKTRTPVVTSQAVVCDQTLKRRLYVFPGRRGKRLNEPGRAPFRTLAVSNIVSAPGTLFRRSFFTELGGFDESYLLLEDWPTWLRLTREGCGISFMDRVTCLYGVGGMSSEALDAYGSPKLRRDMALCYEKEILPYLNELDAQEARQIQFGYDRICGLAPKELWKKYGLLEYKAVLKRSVKKCLLKGVQIFR